MTGGAEWSIIFYTTADGDEPVRAFLAGLDQKTQTRFEWSIEQLRVRNMQATEPLVKNIDGKLWELRRASSGNIYRVMYFFFTGRQIVLLHGFHKKTQKTPRSEIDIAEQRMVDFISRQEVNQNE